MTAPARPIFQNNASLGSLMTDAMSILRECKDNFLSLFDPLHENGDNAELTLSEQQDTCIELLNSLNEVRNRLVNNEDHYVQAIFSVLLSEQEELSQEIEDQASQLSELLSAEPFLNAYRVETINQLNSYIQVLFPEDNLSFLATKLFDEIYGHQMQPSDNLEPGSFSSVQIIASGLLDEVANYFNHIPDAVEILSKQYLSYNEDIEKELYLFLQCAYWPYLRSLDNEVSSAEGLYNYAISWKRQLKDSNSWILDMQSTLSRLDAQINKNLTYSTYNVISANVDKIQCKLENLSARIMQQREIYEKYDNNLIKKSKELSLQMNEIKGNLEPFSNIQKHLDSMFDSVLGELFTQKSTKDFGQEKLTKAINDVIIEKYGSQKLSEWKNNDDSEEEESEILSLVTEKLIPQKNSIPVYNSMNMT